MYFMEILMLSDEHRYHTRLQRYWDKMRGNNPFPKESDINPDELEDIWNSCFLISIDDVTKRLGYRYSYMGKDLIEAYGSDTDTNNITTSLIASGDAPMVVKFNEAVATKVPVIDESEFVNARQLNIRYRTCILPLGTKDGEVTHLLGCMRWKMY